MLKPETNRVLSAFLRTAAALGFAVCLCVLAGAGFDDGHDKAEGPGKTPSNEKDVATAGKAPPQYNLRFGANPFLPSQAKSEHDEFLAPDAFPPASYCATCHADVHAQWRQSAHANSFRAPFYRNTVDLLIHQKGIEFTRHCEGCHNPVALFSGALSAGSPINRSFDEDGITCMVCHSIQRIQNTSGTGSYVMGTPGSWSMKTARRGPRR